jgi:GNAT superfamily N-acetyltransferase
MINPHTEIVIRNAVVEDTPLILWFIEQLAEYERLRHEAVATEEGLRSSLFGPRPDAEVILASVAGEPAGFALFFHNYSTFMGKRGLYLEDLFVKAEFRGNGVGRRLLAYLAALAKERDCGRFEWSVLDWNEPAIQFYKSLGARCMEEWRIFRLTGQSLDALAHESRGA